MATEQEQEQEKVAKLKEDLLVLVDEALEDGMRPPVLLGALQHVAGIDLGARKAMILEKAKK